MQQRTLGPFSVSAIGLGCMNFCHAYGEPVSEAQTERVLLASLDAGITHFDTATLYGFGQSELLLGKYLMAHRKRFTLASKCGVHAVTGPDGKKVRAIDGRPATLRQNCEDSLKRLNTDVIDLYYLHRWDKAVPIEESVGALGDLVKAGKIRAVGLSEVSASTLRKAHAEFPISAVQSEYSLWTRNPEIAVLQTCAELGVALVAFSPVGRGFLTSAPPEPALFGATDFRKNMPRFAPQTYATNCKLLTPFTKIAQEAGCTPAQLAIAWLLYKAPHILPIPGTTSVEHALENAAAVEKVVGPETLAASEALINSQTVQGNRYPVQARSEVDTEEIPGT